MSKNWIQEPNIPPQQGFYWAKSEDGVEQVAEYRQLKSKEPKRWWAHVSEDPTVAKQRVPLEGVTAWARASKDDIAQALKRELTEAEKIAEAYQKHVDTRQHLRAVPVPASRQLAIGTEVYIGALKEAFVVGSFEDGQVLVVRFRHIAYNYGKPLDLGLEYRAFPWRALTAAGVEKDSQLVRQAYSLCGAYINSSIDSLLHRVLDREVDDSPEYQRGYAWTQEDKDRFIESWFEGRDLGRFVFINYRYPRASELMDGKQRAQTLVEFYCSKFAYKGLYWHELSLLDRAHLQNVSIQVAELKAENFSRSALLKMFLDLNAAGVPQTDEHLDKVRGMYEEALKAESMKRKSTQAESPTSQVTEAIEAPPSSTA